MVDLIKSYNLMMRTLTSIETRQVYETPFPVWGQQGSQDQYHTMVNNGVV